MSRLTCLLSAMAASAFATQSTAQAPAEQEAVPDAQRTLCPMPIARVGKHDSIRTVRPDAGIEYFIQAVRFPCHNPLFTPPRAPALAAIPKAEPDEKLAASEGKPPGGEPSAAANGSRAEEGSR